MKNVNNSGVSLLLKWAGKDKKFLFLSIVCAFVSSVMSIVPYYVFYNLIDLIFTKELTKESLINYLYILLISTILKCLFSGVSGVSSHKGAYNTLFKVRCMVTEHISKMPLGTLNERNTGEIKYLMNDSIEKLELFLAHNLPELVIYTTGPFLVFIYLCSVNLILALVSIVPLIIAFIIIIEMFKKSYSFMSDAKESSEKLNSSIIEYIKGMRLIKAFNMSSKSFVKYSKSIEYFHEVWIKMSKKLGPYYASYIVTLDFGLILIVPLGGYLFLKGSIAANAFLLFAFIGTQYLADIRPLQEIGSSFSYVINSIKQVKEILETPIFEGGKDFPKKCDIEIKNVEFEYESGKKVLTNCNMKIDDGEMVAFVGKSGSGKTTLVELVSRFYDVKNGEILIGGVNIKDIEYNKLLENISIVFQNSFLTSASVYENIAMGSGADLNQVRLAAKKAQIDDFIMSLPNKYETLVKSYGTRFSGGEKQRICIARAILKNSPILILDEATSAADPENQVEIDLAISNLCKGKTVLIVAHRLGIVHSCSRIGVIENNTISCIGNWDELIDENGYFENAVQNYIESRNMSYKVEGGR